MRNHKKINYHHYLALKKAFYKPAAWIKGILLPMCQGDCSLKEASIVGSIISKVCACHKGGAILDIYHFTRATKIAGFFKSCEQSLII